MKNDKTVYKTIFGLLIVQVVCLIAPGSVLCQAESLDIIKFHAACGMDQDR